MKRRREEKWNFKKSGPPVVGRGKTRYAASNSFYRNPIAS